MQKNFEYFDTKIAELDEPALAALCQGIKKLVIVDVALSKDQDNPQLIFESMNSTGLDLSQADLIRNYVLMALHAKHQATLYEDHWRPMELAFGQEAYSTQFDAFMRHYLTLKAGDIPNVRAVYQAFKDYAATCTDGIDALIADVHTFAGYFCAIALGQEKDRDLVAAFDDLREMKVDVAYPLLLTMYHDMKLGLLSAGDMLGVARLVESYVFRRAICALPTAHNDDAGRVRAARSANRSPGPVYPPR